MISNTFDILEKQLNAYFAAAPSRGFDGTEGGTETADPPMDMIAFLEQNKVQESIRFPLNKVTPILVNIEQEKQLRPADRYARMSANNVRESVYPDVRLNLKILFVSNFHDYLDSLYYLDLIVKFFQTKPVFDHTNTPALDPEIDQLIFELLTLPFSEQNEVWNALRSAYHPSLLYKVKMLVFQDQPTSIVGVTEVITNINEK